MDQLLNFSTTLDHKSFSCINHSVHLHSVNQNHYIQLCLRLALILNHHHQAVIFRWIVHPPPLALLHTKALLIQISLGLLSYPLLTSILRLTSFEYLLLARPLVGEWCKF